MQYEINTTTTITNADINYSVSVGHEEGATDFCMIRYMDHEAPGLNAEFSIPWDFAVLIANAIQDVASRPR